MGTRPCIKDYQRAAFERCEAIGLHPRADPMGDRHHTDAPFTDEDLAAGDAVAYFLGSLFSDKYSDPESPHKESYFYNEMTSVDIWSRVARALRIHGLKISDTTT